jgi:mannosyltransferase
VALPLRLAFLAALACGAAARLVLAFGRPLWADEIFTLALARRPLGAILDALRADSGPPLHYLAAKLLLLPFPDPGPADVAVRLLSVAASLLHVPLLLAIGRRARAPRAGVAAAALFLVLPLAAVSGAEGRGYALASLLALACFGRLAALREAPRTRTALAAGLLGGAAFLTHYLALLPVAGAFLASLGDRRRRAPALAGGALAALHASAWLPVALAQPRASMAWTGEQPLGERALQFLANLGLGLPADPGAARFLAPFAVAVLGLALLLGRGRARVPAATPLLLGLALLGPLVLWSGAALLPDRTALLFLPLVALVLAQSGPLLSSVAGLTGAAVLGASLRGLLRTTPGAELAKALAPRVRAGSRVVAAELWGPELDYRLARAGLPGRVTLFPSEVARHPGWYVEEGIGEGRLAEEAAAAVRGADARTHFVLSPRTRAGNALVAALARAGGRRAASAGLFEIWVIPLPAPAPAAVPP